MIKVIPFNSIAGFRYGQEINSILESNDKVKLFEKYEEEEEEEYRVSGQELSLYTENKQITTIICREVCYFMGVKLVGSKVDTVIKQLNIKPFGEIDNIYMPNIDDHQLVYEFDQIGLQIWTLKNGDIVTVIGSAYIDPSEI